MKTSRIAWIILAAAMCLIMAGPVAADESKLLRGDVWQIMSDDEKVAFLWGATQVVVVEQALMDHMPELKVENFSAKVVEGAADRTMNETVSIIDNFYAANPDKIEVSVMRVIWDEMIKPNIKTGIGGRPLE
jgi:hypothetical protein